ncbi:hypothetical protein [Nocardia vinacea]|uniref:hypothetical protein n=1 Tax=Nocardia vinacea TaxID=96468 RepID=UPI0002E6ECED|nr:hypothetical protein [Nocardia vinacea]
MRPATEILVIPLLLALILFILSPSTVLAVVFLVLLVAAWRRRPRRSGFQR